jgi:hypothetical protein
MKFGSSTRTRFPPRPMIFRLMGRSCLWSFEVGYLSNRCLNYSHKKISSKLTGIFRRLGKTINRCTWLVLSVSLVRSFSSLSQSTSNILYPKPPWRMLQTPSILKATQFWCHLRVSFKAGLRGGSLLIFSPEVQYISDSVVFLVMTATTNP